MSSGVGGDVGRDHYHNGEDSNEALAMDTPEAQDTSIMVGKYRLGGIIGKGLSSEVRLAVNTVSGEQVALKIIEKDWIWRNDMSTLVQREIDIMQEMDHPAVVKLVEVFNSQTHVYMAMEAVDGRELFEEMAAAGKMDEVNARNLFKQVMQAVRYMHSKGVAHRDIKLENLLLSKDGGSIKVTDFGLAARLDEWEGDNKPKRKFRGKRKDRRQQTACGTPSYAAPELFNAATHGYDARGVDIWCAGVVLYAMVTGSMPFQGENTDATLGLIRAIEPPYPSYLSADIQTLLRGMLHKDPDRRLSVDKILSHAWVTQAKYRGRGIVGGNSGGGRGRGRRNSVSKPPPEQHIPKIPAHSMSHDSLLTESPTALAAAAQQAIKAAREATSTAQRAAADARAAEVSAAQAMAAAAEALGTSYGTDVETMWMSSNSGQQPVSTAHWVDDQSASSSGVAAAGVAGVARHHSGRGTPTRGGRTPHVGDGSLATPSGRTPWGRQKFPRFFGRQSSVSKPGAGEERVQCEQDQFGGGGGGIGADGDPSFAKNARMRKLLLSRSLSLADPPQNYDSLSRTADDGGFLAQDHISLSDEGDRVVASRPDTQSREMRGVGGGEEGRATGDRSGSDKSLVGHWTRSGSGARSRETDRRDLHQARAGRRRGDSDKSLRRSFSSPTEGIVRRRSDLLLRRRPVVIESVFAATASVLSDGTMTTTSIMAEEVKESGSNSDADSEAGGGRRRGPQLNARVGEVVRGEGSGESAEADSGLSAAKTSTILQSSSAATTISMSASFEHPEGGNGRCDNGGDNGERGGEVMVSRRPRRNSTSSTKANAAELHELVYSVSPGSSSKPWRPYHFQEDEAPLATKAKLAVNVFDTSPTSVDVAEFETEIEQEREDGEELTQRRMQNKLFSYPQSPESPPPTVAATAAADDDVQRATEREEPSPPLPPADLPPLQRQGRKKGEQEPGERPTSPAGLAAAASRLAAAATTAEGGGGEAFFEEDFDDAAQSHFTPSISDVPRTPTQHIGIRKKDAGGTPAVVNTPDPHWLTDLVSYSRPLRELGGAVGNIWGDGEGPQQSEGAQDLSAPAGEDRQTQAADENGQRAGQTPIEVCESGELAMDVFLSETGVHSSVVDPTATAAIAATNADGSSGYSLYDKGKNLRGGVEPKRKFIRLSIRGSKKKINDTREQQKSRGAGGGGENSQSKTVSCIELGPSNEPNMIPIDKEHRTESWLQALKRRSNPASNGPLTDRKDAPTSEDSGGGLRRPVSGIFATTSNMSMTKGSSGGGGGGGGGGKDDKDRAKSGSFATAMSSSFFATSASHRHSVDSGGPGSRKSGEDRHKSGSSVAPFSSSWRVAKAPKTVFNTVSTPAAVTTTAYELESEKQSTAQGSNCNGGSGGGGGGGGSESSAAVEREKNHNAAVIGKNKSRKKKGGFRRTVSMALLGGLLGSKSRSSS